MKKIFFLIIIAVVFLINDSYSQERIMRYCLIDFSFRGIKKRRINIDYGISNDSSPFKDSTENRLLEGVREKTTIIEVLNTMESLGWNLINTVANEGGAPSATISYTFIFKKPFLKTALSPIKEP